MDVLETLNREGIQVTAGGNRPVLLDDFEGAWIVQKGSVDVFSVQIKDGKPQGARAHVFSTGENTALFGVGVDPTGSGMGLLAVGAMGTILLKTSRGRLHELASDDISMHEVKEFLDGWTANLLSALQTRQAPPEIRRLVAGRLSMDKGAAYCSAKGVLWARSQEGRSFIRGDVNLPPIAEDVSFPLSEDSWLQAADKCTLSLTDTLEQMKADPDWSFLDNFNHVFCRAIELLREQELSRESERIRKKLANEAADVETVLLYFVRDKDIRRGAIAVEAAEPLFAACKIVGDAMQVNMSPPSASTRERKLGNSLTNIGVASRIRIRRVILEEGWWESNNGPLLAFLEESRHPVALLQPTPDTYVIHDPAGHVAIPVNKRTASELSPVAFTFYRPFPETAVNMGALLKFAFFGNARDIKMIFLMGAVGGLLGLVTPLSTSYVFDIFIPMAQSSQLMQIGAALVISALATAMFDMTRAVAMLRIEGKIDGSVQSAVMDRLLSLPVSFFGQYSVGDLASRTMGINSIRQVLSGAVTGSLLSGVFSSFNLALLFYYSLSLATLGVGLILLTTLITFFLMLANVRYQRELLGIRGRISGLVFQFINGMAKLRVSGSEKKGFVKWLREFQKQKECTLKAGMVSASLGTVNAVTPVVYSMLIFILFYYKEASLSMGQFLAFIAAFSQSLSAATQISNALTSVLSILPLYERALPILTALPEISAAKEDPGDLSGDIEVQNVVFRYKKDHPLILRNVSLSIRAGEFVAVVGPSGSGKSTLLRLLLGFETPEEGSIYYDRQDIQTLDLRVVRRQIGVMLQNGQIMAGSILSNIIGANNLTQEDAWEAARMSGLDKDIEAMPMGMFTMVPPGGSTISGGQRQRLMIARAMATKPRIFFFDEATSALDNITQAIVAKSLEQFHATRLVIAHRLSTVLNADRIVVMDRGVIVENGTYKELMEKGGLFFELAKRQLA
jgi:NHLM bacteriocin system ABC transporter ATP-binding protein